MTTLSDALVGVSESILSKINDLSSAEIFKKGRKYRFVKSSFHRVRDEDKHLVVNPAQPSDHVATISAYSIIKSIDPSLFTNHTDLCLSIVGVAQALEENEWYENENSSVVIVNETNAVSDPEIQEAARDFFSRVTPQHIVQGCTILYCAKLNFLHTDHHIGTTFEGVFLRKYVEMFYGSEALDSPEALAAIKSFVHWGNIRYLLYKLGVPRVKVDESVAERFAAFPEPTQDLKDCVLDRFPSGTTRYSSLCDVIDAIADSRYAQLIPFPTEPEFDLLWLYKLCDDIEQDPMRYHLRSAVKELSDNPVNLTELAQTNHAKLDALSSVASIIVNTVLSSEAASMPQNTKLPAYSDALIAKHEAYVKKLVDTHDSIEEYESKGWSEDDIILRLSNSKMPNFADGVDFIRQKHQKQGD